MIKNIRLAEINVGEEYQKRFPTRHDDRLLDFIFCYKLFPHKLYVPLEACLAKGYLSMLLNDLSRIAILKNKRILSPERIIQESFGDDMSIKNQDEILEEKGELVLVERKPFYERQIEKILLRLYPRKKIRHLCLDTLRLQGRTWKFLLQVGFFNTNRYELGDTLGDMSSLILQEEKALIFPVFKDIFSEILFKNQGYCFSYSFN